MKLGLAVLLAFVSVACNLNTTRLHEAEPPTLDPGWKVVRSDDLKVSIGIPSTFHDALEVQPGPDLSLPKDTEATPPQEDGNATPPAANPVNPEADKALNRFVGDINGMSDQMEQALRKQTEEDMKKHGYVVWAWLNGKPSLSEDRTQISVKKIPDEGGTLEDAISKIKGSMSGQVQLDKVSLPIGSAMVAKTDFQNRIGDEQTEIDYALLDNGDEYVVRFAATNGPEQIQSITDAVMQTLRIKPKS